MTKPVTAPGYGTQRREWPSDMREMLTRGLLSGSLASVLSAVALTFWGKRQSGSALAPINAVSHWYWDDEALRHRTLDFRHTVLGYLTHHGSAVMWATLQAAVIARKPRDSTAASVVTGALVTTAIACFVDYRLTPRRLRPGFEHHLSRGALAWTYLAFAVGLAASNWGLRGYHLQNNPE